MSILSIRNGFLFIGYVNIIGILVFTKAFTDDVIGEVYPIVMSDFGLLVIMTWGLASIALSQDYHKVRQMVGVLAIEKLIYVATWIYWIVNNELTPLFGRDFLAGIYYSTYGPMDFIFMIFFAWVYYSIKQNRTSTNAAD